MRQDDLDAIATMIAHAKEMYPHFESARGQKDIAALQRVLRRHTPNETQRDAESQARAQLASILEMVEALKAAHEADDSDAIDAAERTIHEDALSVEVRGDWISMGADRAENALTEYRILLCTGGPAVRIVGTLDHGQPMTATLQAQGWFVPWFDVGTTLAESEAMLAYAAQFYYGE